MRSWYNHSRQLLFVEETFKNGQDSLRRYAWSRNGKHAAPARVHPRVMRRDRFRNVTDDTRYVHTRWLSPRIRRQCAACSQRQATTAVGRGVEDPVHACGAILLFLPPCSPQFTPIDVMFGQLKRWLARHANLAYAHLLELVLNVTMRESVKRFDTGTSLFRHWGYGAGRIKENVIGSAHRS
ncbi:hypothetical protein PybrP1_006024 [[Pythium] brassicae (nom. inval.)]|nr:hypothetical protein PybrP1_006024 [[Pythium] brassicae (nom. inval.)]